MEDNQSAELMARWRGGDQQAADASFSATPNGFLRSFARGLSSQLARRFDPEDVVQSAYRSFFVGARDGRYVLTQAAISGG